MSTSTKKALEKGVSWGEVEILVFPNILGDNPGVSYGAPLTIGWKPESKETVGVDCFEYFRQSRPRRNRKDLMMKSTSRDTYLLGLGYSLTQLLEAAEETKKIRKHRLASMKGNKFVHTFRVLFDRTAGVIDRGVAAPSVLGGSPLKPRSAVAKSA